MKSKTDIIHAMNSSGIERAANLLRSGEVVAFPTETVYGLGADATNDSAVARIFEAKQRPQFNPLIVHFSKPENVWNETKPSPIGEKLASEFWPGPLTVVVNRRSDSTLSRLVSAGLETVAVRIPAHEKAREMIEMAGCPVAAPSANRSGSISPTCAQHVVESLGDRIPLVLDGGDCSVGLESTIVDISDATPVILRPGGVSQEAIEDALGHKVTQFQEVNETGSAALKAPGQMLSHYAPNASVRLCASKANPGEVLLGFGNVKDATLNLSPESNLVEAAANLFAMLHQLDSQGAKAIAVSPVPDVELGAAINDRLRRAAAPRN